MGESSHPGGQFGRQYQQLLSSPRGRNNAAGQEKR